MGVAAVVGSFFLLDEDMQPLGCLVALATVVVLLGVVTTCGVTVSAIANSTVLGIAILWMVLYGVGFALTLLPAYFPTPDYVLTNLPNILRGHYDFQLLGRLMGWSAAGSV